MPHLAQYVKIGFLSSNLINSYEMNMNFFLLFPCCEFEKKILPCLNIHENSKSCCRGIADTDLASYIWHESPGDIPINMAWTTATSRSNSDNPGGLIMKAKAYTPVIQRFVWFIIQGALLCSLIKK